MRTLLAISFFLAALNLARAQDNIFSRMAEDICQCLEENGGEVSPILARECLRTVALENAPALMENYNLVAAEASQRELLMERLSEELLLTCPLLRTLRMDDEVDDKWSDVQSVKTREQALYSSDKKPPPDPPARVTAEPPWEWRLAGTISQLTADGLTLVDATGSPLELEMPVALRRQHRLLIGAALTVRYRREWRKGKGVVVNVLTEIL